MTATVWSDNQIKSYRAEVNLIQTNFWNRVDTIINGKFAWVFFLVGLSGFIGGVWFSKDSQVAGFIGVGSFFLLYGAYRLSDARKAKPSQWMTVSMAEFLSGRIWGPTALWYSLQEMSEAERAKNPSVEFLVEYLFNTKENDLRLPPANFIVWEYQSFGSQAREVVFVVKNGILQKPQQ